MNKILLISLIVVAVIAVIIGAIFFFNQRNSQAGGEIGIKIFAPTENEVITSPLEIRGTISGNGWNGFEGQAGTVRLVNSEGLELASTYLPAVTDWMQPSVNFKADLEFRSLFEDTGKLIFHNENASGLPDKDREFVLPVRIAKTVEGTISSKLYFNNNKMDLEYSCDKVFPTDRGIPSTKAVALATMEELIKGPTNQEILDGFFTSLNPDTEINRLVINDGVAKIDFDESLQAGVGGSCRTTAIRNQITQTLLQFKTVKSVIISINGRTEGILQP